jgi:hypothetical protein
VSLIFNAVEVAADLRRVLPAEGPSLWRRALFEEDDGRDDNGVGVGDAGASDGVGGAGQGVPSPLSMLEDAVAVASAVELALQVESRDDGASSAAFSSSSSSAHVASSSSFSSSSITSGAADPTSMARDQGPAPRWFVGFGDFGMLCSMPATRRLLVRLIRHYEEADGRLLQSMRLQTTVWRYDAAQAAADAATDSALAVAAAAAVSASAAASPETTSPASPSPGGHHVLAAIQDALVHWGHGNLDAAAAGAASAAAMCETSTCRSARLAVAPVLLLVQAVILEEAGGFDKEVAVYDCILKTHLLPHQPELSANDSLEAQPPARTTDSSPAGGSGEAAVERQVATELGTFALRVRCLFLRGRALQRLGELYDPSPPEVYQVRCIFPAHPRVEVRMSECESRV